MGASATSHARNLASLNIETLQNRREGHALDFAIKCLLSKRHSFWFEPTPNSTANTRYKKPRYLVPKFSTLRAESSPITYYSTLLNNLTEEEFNKLCKNAPPPLLS